MKNIKFKALAAIALVTAMIMLSGCIYVGPGDFSFRSSAIRGTGEFISRDFAVDSFTGVNVAGPVELIYTKAETEAVTISMQENLFSYLSVESSGGTLYIKTLRPFRLDSHKSPKVYISAPAIDSLAVAGAVSFKPEDTITTDNFKLDIAGACDIELNIDAKTFTASCAGAEQLKLSGTAGTLEINSAGAGSVDAMNLTVSSAYITINGVGDVSVNCTDYLDVAINGVGSLEYRGNPEVSKRIAGLGTVRSV